MIMWVGIIYLSLPYLMIVKVIFGGFYVHKISYLGVIFEGSCLGVLRVIKSQLAPKGSFLGILWYPIIFNY